MAVYFNEPEDIADYMDTKMASLLILSDTLGESLIVTESFGDTPDVFYPDYNGNISKQTTTELYYPLTLLWADAPR